MNSGDTGQYPPHQGPLVQLEEPHAGRWVVWDGPGADTVRQARARANGDSTPFQAPPAHPARARSCLARCVLPGQPCDPAHSPHSINENGAQWSAVHFPPCSGHLRGPENCRARALSGESKENQHEGLLMAKPQRYQGRRQDGAVQAEAGRTGCRWAQRACREAGLAMLRRPQCLRDRGASGGSSAPCRLGQATGEPLAM